MDLIALLKRSGWIPAAALVLAVLLSQWGALRHGERYLADMQERLAAPEQHFTDAVVVDIDETSLARLQRHFGTWPYNRDAYALVADWLLEQGAKAVVLDILLADPRVGDDIFAEVLARRRNIVLVAATPSTRDQDIKNDRSRLSALAWTAPPHLPAKHWPALLLPNATLLRANPLVGVVAAEADTDGLLRRLPLAHESAGLLLPALPLAAMAVDFPQSQRGLAGEGNEWGFDSRRWPVDKEGFIHLRYPANANAVLAMPFYEVAEAALGAVTLNGSGAFFKGRTVFIGSTANFADRLQTPRGAMSGTYALAIAHQTLAHGFAWRPASGLWAVLLPLLSLIGLVGMVASTGRRSFLPLAWVVGTALALYTLNLILLVMLEQQTSLLLPLLWLAIGWGLHSMTERLALHREITRLEREADLDSLTGLPVRRALLRNFHRDLAMARRYHTPLSVAIMDLDHFKRVNDTYGHPVGDLVLKTFAKVLQSTIRNSDSIGRWGGEEFVAVLPNTDTQGAVAVLDKIRLAIAATQYPTPADDLKTTMSAGVTTLSDSDLAVEQPGEAIIGQADLALYQAKESGRNRICVISPQT